MSTTTKPETDVVPHGAPEVPVPAWTIEAARTLYNIEGWGDRYFDINEKGHVVVRPDRDRAERTLDLYELACDLEAQGVNLPVLLRFSDILRSRIESLNANFQSAIKEFDYSGADRKSTRLNSSHT